MTERVGNVTRSRYEEIVAESRKLIAQIGRARFGLGNLTLGIEPIPVSRDDVLEAGVGPFADGRE